MFSGELQSMLNRLSNPLLSRSFFLFGARGTGKTTLLKRLLTQDEALFINLLLPSHYDELALEPELLIAKAEALPADVRWIVIDEVQKLPRLLDIVHHLIEDRKLRFALTGSSARKLKRGSANLLAGRASVYNLFPFTSWELEEQCNLQDALEWGTLPALSSITSREEKTEFLESYAYTYLKEEIGQEQIVRKLEPFRKFLAVAAQCNAKIINYKKISEDVGVSAVTIKSYFEILEDTLIGFFLEPYHQSIRKSQRQSPKFYLFDAGVERALSRCLDVPLKQGTYAFGVAFESFFVNEVFRLNQYHRKGFQLSYLRTKDDAEVDLILSGRKGTPPILIEIKSARLIKESDARNLRAFAADIPKSKAILVSLDPSAKKFANVIALPWQQALKEIFV